MTPVAVAIFGPTGVGKTALSLELTRDCGEIISVDSRQIYKYMDIGTAKPTLDEQKFVKHHLIDIITPDITYMAGEFKRNSEKLIAEITARGKIPFLIGGTGLYFNSLMFGMAEIPAIGHETKTRLYKKWHRWGQKRMHDILLRVDPVYGNKIHWNDKQRTLRALEIFLETGNNFSYFLNSGNIREDITFINIGLNLDRKILYDRINKRVDIMIENGLIDEVKKLLGSGCTKNDPGMKSIGYREIIDYLEDRMSLDEAINLMKKKSRNYAKRQICWFKNMPETAWFQPDDLTGVKKYLKDKIPVLI